MGICQGKNKTPSVTSADRAFPAYGLFQREHDGDAPETNQRHIAKIVHIGPHPRLHIHVLGQQSVSAVESLCGRCTLRRQIALHPANGSDRKSTRLNSSHSSISYAVFCLKKKKK